MVEDRECESSSEHCPKGPTPREEDIGVECECGDTCVIVCSPLVSFLIEQ